MMEYIEIKEWELTTTFSATSNDHDTQTEITAISHATIILKEIDELPRNIRIIAIIFLIIAFYSIIWTCPRQPVRKEVWNWLFC